MNSTVRALSTVAIFSLLAGCSGMGAHSAMPSLSPLDAARSTQQIGTPGQNAPGAASGECRVIVESATADGPATALGTNPCTPSNDGTAVGIAVNTAGGYDVLFTDTATSKDVVRRYSGDGAATVSSLVLNFLPVGLADDRGGHEIVDTPAGRIVKYASAATDQSMPNSDATLAGSPQLNGIAVSPGADRTVYVVSGVAGNQSIYAVAPDTATIQRTIGTFGANSIGALAVDAQGLLYVALNSTNPGAATTIQVFDATANGTPVPLRTITASPGASHVKGLAVTPGTITDNPTLYASQQTNVLAFPLGANGVTAPSRTIVPHPNQSQRIVGLAVSADGTLDILENYIPTLSCAQNAISGAGVPLGTDASFAVLAASTVTNGGPTIVTGNLGVSPGTAVTGFGPGTVTGGSIHAGDPTAAQAQLDLTTAYNNAAGRLNPAAISADIGGLTIAPGLYAPPTTLALTGNVTLDGKNNPNSVFIFQVASSMSTSVNSSVTLINGAQACNVFWQVGSSATINTNNIIYGTILAHGSVSVGTGSTLHGRALAANGAVTMLSDTMTVPGP